jgi:O-antigen/teichoic acid export membrane protein
MKLIKNVYIFSVFSKINVIFFTIIGSIVISRYLGPSLRGEYSYSINYISIISLILSFSLTKAIPYFQRKYGESVYQEFINLSYIQTLFFLVVSAAAALIFNDNVLTLILFFSVFSQFYNQISYIAIIKNINFKNLITVIDTFIYTILLIVLVFISPFDKLLLVYFMYFFKIIIGMTAYLYYYKIYPRKVKLNLKRIIEMYKFSFFPMISALLITFNYKIDIIILKQFETFYNIGLYSLAVTIASMLWIIPDAFKDVLFNKTSKNDSISSIVFSIKFNLYLSIFAIFGFILLGSQFVSILYGSEFIDSTKIIIMLLIGSVPMIFFKMINTLYIAKGKQLLATLVLFISVVLNIILNYQLIPKYSIEGAAIASVISYSVCGTVFLYTFCKDYSLKISDLILLNKQDFTRFKKIFRRL